MTEDPLLVVGSIKGLRHWRLEGYSLRSPFQRAYPLWLSGENVSLCHQTLLGANYSWDQIHQVLSAVRQGEEVRSAMKPHPLNNFIPSWGTAYFRDCHCGFYCVWDRDNEYGRRTDYQRKLIGGIIEGYGRVSIGPLGARFEKAKVAALHLPKGFWNLEQKGFKRNYPDIRIYVDYDEMVEKEGVTTHPELLYSRFGKPSSSFG